MKSTKKDPGRWIRLRIVLVGVGFCSVMLVFVGRAVQLHLLKGGLLAQKASDQYEKRDKRFAKRGIIYDRNYEELAASVEVDSICANPKKCGSGKHTAELLATILKTDTKDIYQKLSSSKSFVWIKRNARPDEVSKVKEKGLAGISFIEGTRRFYPNKSLAAQLIGFTGTDGCGLEGLEYTLDSTVKGISTTHTVLKDAFGRSFRSPKNNRTGQDGQNVVLTIDKNIQYITENALSEGVREAGAKSGMAVVVVPATGEILAVANIPTYNPNVFWESECSTWRNRAFSDAFEPGSTFKVFLAVAALETGACTPNSIFYCENGRYKIGRRAIHDMHQFGWLSLQQIVKMSSNIGAAKVGERVGVELLDKTLNAFGFGKKTGVKAPGETAGRLSSHEKWSDMDAAAISFGQGVSVSVLQMAMALSAIANNGILMKPLLVSKITDVTGKVVKHFKPTCVRQAVSACTARAVTRILKTVIAEGGTGVRAALPAYSVAGKTGTAQKADLNRGGYLKDRYIASFVGFAPADDPEIVVVVQIDEPKKEIYGGVVAAPVFQEICGKTLRYMKILPERELMASNQTGTMG
jgi:cell division protein FtsI (penicillin-binding protein 3)